MAENRNKIKSSTPILSARIVRWLAVAAGLTVAYLIPFPDYVGVRTIGSLLLVGWGVFKDYQSTKQNKERDVQSLKTEEIARKALDDVEDVKRGRRLSPKQKAAITKRLSTANLKDVKLA